jgi:hypothetical protein
VQRWAPLRRKKPEVNRKDPSKEELALHHRNRHASDLTFGIHLHGLLGAVGAQDQIGAKSDSLDDDVDQAMACGALQVADNVTARFTPIARDVITLAGHIAAQFEFIAVAGAAKRLLQAHSGAGDLVVGLTSDVLGRSVGKRNGPVAGPCSVKADKWAGLGVGRCRRQQERGTRTDRLDDVSKQT